MVWLSSEALMLHSVCLGSEMLDMKEKMMYKGKEINIAASRFAQLI